MGKNYTLYIKHDVFDTEANKSGLVNELLERHYDGPINHQVKKFKAIIDDDDPIDLEKMVPLDEEPLPEPEWLVQSVAAKVTKTHCEHGQPKGQCLWKGCKYAR